MLRGVYANFIQLKRFVPSLHFSTEASFWISRSMKKRERHQKYKSFLVLDFEATCERNTVIEPQEIIEFPCIKINAETCEVEDIFHQYVKPKENPILTPFCTELTGILQDMVDDRCYFEETFYMFQDWLRKVGSWDADAKTIFVTCGDWDLNVMLPKQCAQTNMDIPDVMKRWINIKKAFSVATGHYPRGIKDMLRRLQLPHEGRLHSGIDDCRNIEKILKELINRGFVFEQTGSLQMNDVGEASLTFNTFGRKKYVTSK